MFNFYNGVCNKLCLIKLKLFSSHHGEKKILFCFTLWLLGPDLVMFMTINVMIIFVGPIVLLQPRKDMLFFWRTPSQLDSAASAGFF